MALTKYKLLVATFSGTTIDLPKNIQVVGFLSGSQALQLVFLMEYDDYVRDFPDMVELEKQEAEERGIEKEKSIHPEATGSG